jgi:hypothetical protein
VLTRLLALGAVLTLAAVLPSTTVAAKPPSFAHWAQAENAYTDSLVDPIMSSCDADYPGDDLQLGECVIAELARIYPGLNVHWRTGLTRVTKPQRTACKNAIKTYSLAAQKDHTASLAYLRSHPQTGLTEFHDTVTSGQYKTLTDAKDAARAKAIRVCG